MVAIRVPKYRLHKAKGLAVVTIDGRHRYLGPYDSEPSHKKYRQLVAEWLAANEKLAAAPEPESVSGFWGVANLIECYLAFARKYYSSPDAKQTSEYNCVISALAPLAEIHGATNVHEYGPRKLKELRALLVSKDWSRTVINATLSRIRRMFKWAVSEELISPTILHGLQAVSGLRAGRSEARETDPIKPVADEYVNATLPYANHLHLVGGEAAQPLADKVQSADLIAAIVFDGKAAKPIIWSVGTDQCSARTAVDEASKAWRRIVWDGATRSYRSEKPSAEHPEPNWSFATFEEMIEEAFAGRIITDGDDPRIAKILGEGNDRDAA